MAHSIRGEFVFQISEYGGDDFSLQKGDNVKDYTNAYSLQCFFISRKEIVFVCVTKKAFACDTSLAGSYAALKQEQTLFKDLRRI